MPDILTKKEVLDILNHIANDKHRLIISFLYGSGLRVSEVVNLKIKDFNFADFSLKIKNSKENKNPRPKGAGYSCSVRSPPSVA